MPLTEDAQKLWQIFHPYAWKEEAKAKDGAFRFAHYTRAESALNILKSQRFWLRKANCMTDFTEVLHGLDCLIKTYNGTKAGERFQKTINAIFPDFTSRIEPLFNRFIPSIKDNTYIACFSVHLLEDDQFGRLSMWRAYGSNTGVALVLRFSPTTTLVDKLQVSTSPVAYLTDQEFQVQLDEITNNIEANIEFVRAQSSANIENYVFRMFVFAAVSLKNPCFREEREWRLLYAPDIYKSEGLIASSESIGGVPQPVFSIPLVGIPELDFVSQFERIIIGPTQYPIAVGQTFITELERLGVTDAREKIKFSNIPLRT